MAPKVEPKKDIYFELPKPKPEPPLVLANPADEEFNTNNLRAENDFFGDRQKIKLNNIFDTQEERDNSALIGGTSGSTAAQFGQSEANVRNSGVIKIKNTELSYDYSTNQFVKTTNPNAADFVNKVGNDLNKMAPGTELLVRPSDAAGQAAWDKKYGSDTAAVVKPASLNQRVSGHDAGYRLIDQLQNNPNEIAIHKYPSNDNAFAAPRNHGNSLGSIFNPGSGSAVDVSYNPDAVIDLTAKNPKGQIVNSPTSAALILGHELNHASHMQRGTNSSISGNGGRNNVFTVNGKSYIEADNTGITLQEEFRTVGMKNYNYGNEPSENRLRTELGNPDQRISYQGQNSHIEINRTQAFAENTSNRFRLTSEAVNDGFRGSRNSALLGGGFSAITAFSQGKNTQEVLTDTAIGTGTGIGEEVIERVVNGPRSATTGMTSSNFQAARATLKGAAVAGAVINTGFAVYDQFDNLQNDATRSQAVGTIAGEAVVGAASGAAGAYTGAMAGAAIGSIVPGVGTVVGAVVGFAVGAAVGYLADKGLRGLGVDTLVAQGVTAAYDGISNAASNVAEGAKNVFSGAANTLSSIFG